MAGDLPDWTQAPIAQAQGVQGVGKYLQGGANVSNLATNVLLYVVPAGKTFYMAGLSFGIQAQIGLLGCICVMTDNGSNLFTMAAGVGFAMVLDTPVPVAAGHTLLFQVAENSNPQINMVAWVNAWGWLQ